MSKAWKISSATEGLLFPKNNTRTPYCQATADNTKVTILKLYNRLEKPLPDYRSVSPGIVACLILK
jgi:hypothetical protein